MVWYCTNKLVILLIFCVFYSINVCYSKNLEELVNYFILIEQNINADYINIFNDPQSFEYKKIENKLYSEFKFFNKNAIGGYIKQSSINSFIHKSKRREYYNDNYFFNIFVSKNLFYDKKNSLSLEMHYFDAINFNKEIKYSLEEDIFTSIMLKLDYIYNIDKHFLKFFTSYKYLQDSFKDQFSVGTSITIQENYSSLLILEYSFIKDLYKNSGPSIGLKKISKKDYIKDNHKLSIKSMFKLKDNFAFLSGANITIHRKAEYGISLGFAFFN